VRKKPPVTRDGTTHRVQLGDAVVYMTANTFENGEFAELFIDSDREGDTIGGLLDAVAIGISLGVQNGVSLDQYVGLYKGMDFEPHGVTGNPEIPIAKSFIDYIARWLELKFVEGGDDRGGYSK
jgi:ribonucleoside-diphosphate reductase alpha chain